MSDSDDFGGSAEDPRNPPMSARPAADTTGGARAQPNERLQVPSIPDLELDRRIGRGAYGEVWLSRTLTGVYRATKIVLRGSDDLQGAFEREYQGIRNYEPISLSHPSLMDVVRVGRNDREGFFYYEMELADDANGSRTPLAVSREYGQEAEGSPLDPATYDPFTLRRLLRNGRIPVEACARLGIELLSALGALHRRDRIHRDVKPSNIIFVDGQAKLSDVGLVALADASRSAVGTPGYVPVEGPGSPSDDLFSLGKVLYEASTRKDRTEFPEAPTVLDPPEEEKWAAFDSEGKRVVTAAADGTARVWDADSGELLPTPLSHEGMLHHALFSLDGKGVGPIK